MFCTGPVFDAFGDVLLQFANAAEQPVPAMALTYRFLSGFENFLGHVGLLLTFLLPLVLFALIVHWLEQTIQGRLSKRFGWNSVLWTGWLGTPIHESSHALMCAVFRHRIDEVSFFEPDRKSGRLGYVRHSFRKGNWFEELGNVFIGIAPLFGGSLVLLGLLWLFYPAAASLPVATSSLFESNATVVDNGWWQVLRETSHQSWGLVRQIVTLDNLMTVRFWIFTYLVLCVGSHMAPSESDYAGTLRGVCVLATLSLVMLIAATLFRLPLEYLLIDVARLLVPLFAVLGLTVVLCLISTGAAMGVISLWPSPRVE